MAASWSFLVMIAWRRENSGIDTTMSTSKARPIIDRLSQIWSASGGVVEIS